MNFQNVSITMNKCSYYCILFLIASLVNVQYFWKFISSFLYYTSGYGYNFSGYFKITSKPIIYFSTKCIYYIFMTTLMFYSSQIGQLVEYNITVTKPSNIQKRKNMLSTKKFNNFLKCF